MIYSQYTEKLEIFQKISGTNLPSVHILKKDRLPVAGFQLQKKVVPNEFKCKSQAQFFNNSTAANPTYIKAIFKENPVCT